MFILLICSFAASAWGVQVKTTEGIVEGTLAAEGFYEFYDIPYAGPVNGSNRFQAPKPPSPYVGNFTAVNRNIVCAQPASNGFVGIENCLTLSIFTRNTTDHQPVIVWLNAENYDSSVTQGISYNKIVHDGIVLVKLNFRLSIFGFLCMGTEDAPGNAGIKDIIQGLTWIKNNIGSFGGDAYNIILAGHAAGAALTDLVTISPKSRDLVNKAISLSGSALAPWAVAPEPKKYAREVGTKIKYIGKSIKQLMRHLKSASILNLMTAINNFKFTNQTELFAPCIEKPKLKSNDAVLTLAPIDVLRSGDYEPVNYIYAYTTEEGTARVEEAIHNRWLEDMQVEFEKFVPADLNLKDNKTVLNTIRKYYFHGDFINKSTIHRYFDYHGDISYLVPVIRAAKEKTERSRAPIYLLEFGYQGTLNSDWKYKDITLHGARHGDLLKFLFDYDLRAADAPVAESFRRRIKEFAYRGLNSRRLSNDTWPPTGGSFNYLSYKSMNNTSGYIEEIASEPQSKTYSFWEELYSKYYSPPHSASGVGNLQALGFLILFCALYSLLFS